MAKSPDPALIAHPKKVERRIWKRFPIYAEVQCQTNEKGQTSPWSGLVLNISRGGVKLVSAHQLEVGNLVRIAKPGSPSLLARVVHVAAENGGMWAMGCTFTPKLGEDQLHEWTHGSAKTV
jgi:PilZ domain